MHNPDPSKIFAVGLGFMGSKVLLSAIELELFTVLGGGARTALQLGERLSLHPRSIADFLDVLVSQGFLSREGDGATALYANSADADLFLDKNKPSYIGGIFEMANHRLYGFWGELTEGLKTGRPQNEIQTGGDLFAELYADENRLEEFLHAMAGAQMGNFIAFAEKFDFGRYNTFCDIGGAGGALAVQVALRNPHLRCETFDLPAVKPLAERFVGAMGVSDRVDVTAGDFFEGPLPSADVVTMGNVLHDWDESQKQTLISKAYDAVRPGGAFVAIEMVIDDERRTNTMGMLMSLNMLIETEGGFDYTGAQFDTWARAAGFSRTEIVPLTGPTSAAIAYKD